MRFAFLASLVAVAPLSAKQVPPPPPPESQQGMAEKIVQAYNKRDIEAYGNLLADDVVVYQDSEIVARSRKEWLKLFQPMFTSPGVILRLYSGYEASGRLLFLEYFSSVGSWGRGDRADCCRSYNAVSYSLENGKIERIQNLRGGSDKVVP